MRKTKTNDTAKRHKGAKYRKDNKARRHPRDVVRSGKAVAASMYERPIQNGGDVVMRISSDAVPGRFMQENGRWGARATARAFRCHAAMLAFAIQNGVRDFAFESSPLRLA